MIETIAPITRLSAGVIPAGTKPIYTWCCGAWYWPVKYDRRGRKAHSHGEERTLKNWQTWALIVAGLLYALWFQFGPQQEPVELPSGPVPLQDQRALPHDNPPPVHQPSRAAPTFAGYPCSGDCSEDKAGYRWAEQNGITDADACTGSSGPFIEGCRAYARQRAAGSIEY